METGGTVGHGSDVTAVIVWMLLVVIAGVVVLAVVAVPQLREGRRVLTPGGREQVSEARRRARTVASQARRVATDVADQAGQKAATMRADRAAGSEPGPGPAPRADLVRAPVRRLPVRRARVADRGLSWEHLEPGPRHARG